MSDCDRPNLLTIIPGNITIQNFVSGRVYKETLMIYNTCNVPIVINLKSSDKSKLSLSESKMRIGVNQANKLDLIIQDKMNYQYVKNPIKQKKLFIHITGDLIDVKYEINLLYYDKNRNNNKNMNSNNINPNYINNKNFNPIGNDIPNQINMNMNMNNNMPYSEYPQRHLNENPNKFINRPNINNQNIENYNNQYIPQYSNNNNINPKLNNNIIENEETQYIPIEQYDNEEVISLKNIINDLYEKVISLQSLLEQNKINQQNIKNKNCKNQNMLKINHNSFHIFGSGIETEIKNKYKVDDDIEIQRILSKNKILELENSTLLFRIKSLEKKLSIYGNNNYNNEEDENDIEDFDADMENNNMEEEKYINNNDYNNFLRNDIKNYNSNEYKYIYKNEKTYKYLDNDKNHNIDFNKNININEIPELYQEKNDDNFEYNVNFNDEK